MLEFLEPIGRLLLACILGGVIGYEREQMQRPAGFRTHILVCVGAALVMVTSEYLFTKYVGVANMDPARLGAQVISGIGFLGAGTIIREGFNIKGLTTAASLWTVACVGIAVGVGFYSGAVAVTIIIFLTLISLKRLEGFFLDKETHRNIYIQAENNPAQVGYINEILTNNGVFIQKIEFTNNKDDKNMQIKLFVKLPRHMNKGNMLNELVKLEGIQKVYDE